MQPKISIVMPCYRAERYIEATLRDILAQTYENWELICVSNGAGQEAQLQILERYSRIGGGKILVVTEEKGNVSNARNAGMARATGKWLTFVDADDRMTPNHLQRYIEAAQGGDYDIVVGGFDHIRVREGQTDHIVLEDLKGLAAKRHLINGNAFARGSTCNKLYCTEFVKKSGVTFIERYKFKEDCIFNKQLLLQTDNVRTFPSTGYRYLCVDHASITTKYKGCLEEVTEEGQRLQAALKLQIGIPQSQIDSEVFHEQYLNGYFFVCNLFKKGSPLSFKECRREIQRIVFDDAGMRAAIEAHDRGTSNLFLKIYDRAYDTGSAWCMAVIFHLQYWLKYHLMPLYLKVAPRLRR